MTLSIWWAIPGLIAILGVLLTFGGLARLMKFRIYTGGSRFLFGGVFLGGAAAATLFGLNLQTYARLTHERAAAEVTISQTGNQAYQASVRTPGEDGQYGEPIVYQLTGDAFRVDARFLKWRPWANITGQDSLYRLDRIQGRFDDVDEENANPPKAYSMSSEEGMSAALDIYTLARKNELMKGLKAVDAIYGNGIYAPMQDGAVYEIMAMQSGLVPRPRNDIATEAVKEWGGPAADALTVAAAEPNNDASPVEEAAQN